MAILALASAILLPNFAKAQTQGTLGATSTGTANISITKSVQARINFKTKDGTCSASLPQMADDNGVLIFKEPVICR